MAHADIPAPSPARRTSPLRRGSLGRRSCLARTMSGSRRSSGSSGSACRRLAAPAVRRCLVIRICDIVHPSVVRVVSILTVKGREEMTRCRHGQHPHYHQAGCHLGMPASRNSTLLEQLDRSDRGPGACWRRAPILLRCDLAIRAVRRGRPSRHARPVPCPRSPGTRRPAGGRARSRPRAALPRCC